MSDRLRSIREKLYDYLTHKLRTPGVWTHFRGSRGMYRQVQSLHPVRPVRLTLPAASSAVLLDPMQIRTLATREHIHLLPDGCFSLGCLNAAKIELLARAIDRVVRHPEMLSMEMDPGAYMPGDEGAETLHLEMTLHESFPGYE
jgi:aspartate aminotransferase